MFMGILIRNFFLFPLCFKSPAPCYLTIFFPSIGACMVFSHRTTLHLFCCFFAVTFFAITHNVHRALQSSWLAGFMHYALHAITNPASFHSRRLVIAFSKHTKQKNRLPPTASTGILCASDKNNPNLA